MGMFGKILEKLGIGHKEEAPPSGTSGGPPSPTTTTVSPPPAKPAAVVDVAAHMEQRAAENPEQLNWRTSIVDLLKLLDMDSSYGARQELARELGCPPDLLEDSAQMNVWLHRAVLDRIAENGGRVPPELLD